MIRIKSVRGGVVLATAISVLSGVAAARAASMTETARNPHGFVLKITYRNFTNGNWSGDGDFIISACPKPACFRLSGPVKLPRSASVPHINEGAFPVVGTPCQLRIEEALKNGMDSGDWRVSIVGADRSGKGCASLPSELEGLYSQVG